MEQPPAFDIFISHHDDDLDFVEAELLPRLAGAGLAAATGEDLRGGTNRLAEMARLIRESRHTLALVTPAWLADGLTDFQAQLSQYFDPGARRQRFVPLLWGATALPAELAALQAVDLNDPRRWQRRLEQLAEQLARANRPTPPPQLDPLALYRAPRPAILFGRDDLIAQLARDLSDPDGHTALALSALRGLPGVGKTALALHLAHHPQVTAAFPDGIFWVALGPQMDDNTLLAELARFIAALGGSALGLTSPEQHSRVLAALLAQRRLLLVLDDCWKPAHARPFRDALPPAGRCLITTRYASVANELGASPREIPVLDAQPSLDLLAAGGDLARQAVEGNPDNARKLADALGHLPLALEVAARYLQKLAWADGPAQALAALRVELAAEEGRVLHLRAGQRRPGLDEAEPSLEAVLALSYTALTDDESREAFARLAVCGAQPLTFEAGLLAALWDAGRETGLAESRHNEIRAELVDAGLLTRQSTGDAPARYSLHQTIAAYVAARLDATGTRRVMELAHARYYQSIVGNYDDWISAGRMTYAVPAEWDGVTLAIERLAALQQTDDEAAHLLIRYSHNWRNVLFNNHDPRRGGWLAAATTAAERIGNSLDQANVLKAQGDVLSFQDKRDEALGKYERALALFQAVGARLGEANVLLAMGDILRAEKEYSEAWQRYEAVFHLYNAIGDRYSIARVLYRMGDWQVAQENFADSIRLFESAIGLWEAIGLPDLAAQIIQPKLDAARGQLQ